MLIVEKVKVSDPLIVCLFGIQFWLQVVNVCMPTDKSTGDEIVTAAGCVFVVLSAEIEAASACVALNSFPWPVGWVFILNA